MNTISGLLTVKEVVVDTMVAADTFNNLSSLKSGLATSLTSVLPTPRLLRRQNAEWVDGKDEELGDLPKFHSKRMPWILERKPASMEEAGPRRRFSTSTLATSNTSVQSYGQSSIDSAGQLEVRNYKDT